MALTAGYIAVGSGFASVREYFEMTELQFFDAWPLKLLMGLLIAIPSLIAWSYYSKKVEIFAVEMEGRCDEFLRRQYRDLAKK